MDLSEVLLGPINDSTNTYMSESSTAPVSKTRKIETSLKDLAACRCTMMLNRIYPTSLELTIGVRPGLPHELLLTLVSAAIWLPLSSSTIMNWNRMVP